MSQRTIAVLPYTITNNKTAYPPFFYSRSGTSNMYQSAIVEYMQYFMRYNKTACHPLFYSRSYTLIIHQSVIVEYRTSSHTVEGHILLCLALSPSL